MPLPQEILNETYLFMGALVLCGVTYKVVEGNYSMIAPHLKTLFWTVYVGLALGRLKRYTAQGIEWLSTIRFKIKLAIFFAVAAVYFAVCVPLIVSAFTQDSTVAHKFVRITIVLFLGGILVAPLVLDHNTFATIILIVVFGVGTLGLLMAVAAQCVVEIGKLSSMIQEFVYSMQSSLPSSADEFWGVVDKRCKTLSALNFQISDKFQFHPGEVCSEKIALLRDNLPSITSIGLSHLQAQIPILVKFGTDAFGMVATGLGDFVFSFILFLSCLYYFVKYDRILGNEALHLLPFSQEQSGRLYQKLFEKIIQTFELSAGLGISKQFPLGLIIVALLNFLTSILAFWYIGSDIIWIFGFLSGFLAIVPIFSSWLVWLPAGLVLLARDGLLSLPWIIMVVSHLISWAISSSLHTFIGGEHEKPEVVGLSLVLGLYAFGPYGAVWGPMLTAAMLAIITFYKDSMTKTFDDEPPKPSRATSLLSPIRLASSTPKTHPQTPRAFFGTPGSMSTPTTETSVQSHGGSVIGAFPLQRTRLSDSATGDS